MLTLACRAFCWSHLGSCCLWLEASGGLPGAGWLRMASLVRLTVVRPCPSDIAAVHVVRPHSCHGFQPQPSKRGSSSTGTFQASAYVASYNVSLDIWRSGYMDKAKLKDWRNKIFLQSHISKGPAYRSGRNCPSHLCKQYPTVGTWGGRIELKDLFSGNTWQVGLTKY